MSELTEKIIEVSMQNVRLETLAAEQSKRIVFLERLVDKLAESAAVEHAKKYPTSPELYGFTTDASRDFHKNAVINSHSADDSRQ